VSELKEAAAGLAMDTFPNGDADIPLPETVLIPDEITAAFTVRDWIISSL